MAIVVTAIVSVGSLFGSALRQLSRTSQAQVTYILNDDTLWLLTDVDHLFTYDFCLASAFYRQQAVPMLQDSV